MTSRANDRLGNQRNTFLTNPSGNFFPWKTSKICLLPSIQI